MSLLFLLAIATTTIFVSCKKEADLFVPQKVTKQFARGANPNLSINANYGFLVFNETENIENYKNYLIGRTHGEVQEYLHSLGFSSLGSKIFINVEDVITDEQYSFYFLNVDAIFEVKNVIMRPTEQMGGNANWKFLLTMMTEYLNATNYGNLKEGSYNSNVMNKFTCGQTIDGDLFDFISTHPFGFENNINIAQAASRPFWGSRHVITRHDEAGYYTDCIVDYHFWIAGKPHGCTTHPY